MSDGVDLEVVWDLVREIIPSKGRLMLCIDIEVNSPAGSGAWRVYQWEEFWWLLDVVDAWHGPFDMQLEALDEFELWNVSADEGRFTLYGPLARRALDRLVLFAPPETDGPLVVTVNETPYRATIADGAIVKWTRMRES